jgi:DNA-directed RNA polymerase specialized sigma24 family protein
LHTQRAWRASPEQQKGPEFRGIPALHLVGLIRSYCKKQRKTAELVALLARLQKTAGERARATSLPRQHEVSDDVARKLVEQYAAGTSSYQLAKAHGLRRNTVRNVLRRNGIELREGNVRALSDEQKTEIRQRRSAGETLAVLAADFGVSVTTIKRALSAIGRTYSLDHAKL